MPFEPRSMRNSFLLCRSVAARATAPSSPSSFLLKSSVCKSLLCGGVMALAMRLAPWAPMPALPRSRFSSHMLPGRLAASASTSLSLSLTSRRCRFLQSPKSHPLARRTSASSHITWFRDRDRDRASKTASCLFPFQSINPGSSLNRSSRDGSGVSSPSAAAASAAVRHARRMFCHARSSGGGGGTLAW
eukprot:scaffold78159_cov64-Phaeocystis_antarctica.AAC.1